MALHFEIYTDARGEGRWRLIGRNGQIVADGGEGYSRVRDVPRAIKQIQRAARLLADAPTTPAAPTTKATPKRALTKTAQTTAGTLETLVAALLGVGS